MLRLAFVATLMYSAAALTTTGDFFTMYTVFNTNIATSSTNCATQTTGTTAGPIWAATNGTGSRAVLLDQCYQTDADTDALFAVNNVFAVAAATLEGSVRKTVSNVTEVKWSVDTNDVKMSAYTGTADGCAGTTTTLNGTAETAGGDGPDGLGWQCDLNAGTGTGAMSMGVANGAANGAKAVYTGAKYVTVGTNIGHTADTADCTTPATTVGQSVDYWPVCQNDADCVVGSCSTATTVAAPARNYSECLGLATPGSWTNGSGNATKAHWGLCYPTANHAGSWQLSCDQETGNIVRKNDADSTFCGWAGSSADRIFTKSDKCELTVAANTASWLITNSDAEWDAICSIPAHTSTKKYFKGYYVATQSECATHTDAAVAAKNDGTRNVFMDVCYPLDSNNYMPGWTGPFSAGASGLEPVNGAVAIMFHEEGTGATAEIEMHTFAYHDCSGLATKVTSDDPADAWCQNSSAISHGAVGTTGNAATQLQTAINYLTVRQHTDTIAASLIGLPGSCLGEANVTSSTHLDYFRVGTSAADGCQQADDGVSAVTVASGYSWWCDSSDASINFGSFGTADCSASQLAGGLKFTKKAYDACTEADALDGTDTCTAAGPATAIENPTAFVYATVTTLVNGATGDFGGKCLTQASNVSYEILTDDATWDAICSIPTPAPTDATTSGAGKIAATVAAAAAALLL